MGTGMGRQMRLLRLTTRLSMRSRMFLLSVATACGVVERPYPGNANWHYEPKHGFEGYGLATLSGRRKPLRVC